MTKQCKAACLDVSGEGSRSWPATLLSISQWGRIWISLEKGREPSAVWVGLGRRLLGGPVYTGLAD